VIIDPFRHCPAGSYTRSTLESGQNARSCSVRHAPVTIDPDVMASDWKREASILALLDSVEISRLERIVTSQEVKAKQTGELLAAHLGLPLEVRPGLEEHHRGQADFLSETGFKAALASSSSCDKIVFGEHASMHLHVFEPSLRHQGIGAECVSRGVDIYFEKLRLKCLFCEPNAFNVGPNRALQKAGFRYVKTHMTVPGPLNFRQAVTRWVIEREAN